MRTLVHLLAGHTRWLVVLGLALALLVPSAASAVNQAATHQVSIVEPSYDNTDTWTFEPNLLKIKVGDTVVWTNRGADPHDVTAEDQSFQSGGEGNMNPGDTFSFTFAAPGTFPYICAAHPWMRGTVVVE